MKKMLLSLFALSLFASTIAADIIHVEAVVDGKSELVISPTGLFWHHINNAKPGNYGESYEIAGPTYIDGVAWTPTWTTPPAQRVEDISSTISIDTSLFSGFELSLEYNHYFDDYTGGAFPDLGTKIQLNRGSVTLSDYNGFPSILINDTIGGQNVYSFDILVPDPATLGLLSVGLMGLPFRHRPRKLRKN